MSKITKQQSVILWVTEKIEHGIYLSGDKIPSIRQLAKQLNISVFTVNQAYEKLVAQGTVEAKKNSGFFVCQKNTIPPIKKTTTINNKLVNTAWLMHHLISQPTQLKSPGSGVLPKEWLFYERLPAIIKHVANTIHQFIYQTTDIQGYLPLRKHYSLLLNQMGIITNENELITESGVSSALNLISRYLLSPGDTVVVDNPGWFWLMGSLQAQGLNVIGIDRDDQGPNIKQLKQCFKNHNAKAYVTNSVLHNPTSYNLSPSRAYQVISLLHQYDAYIIEDDIYAFFDQSVYDRSSFRYASLDRSRIFYTTGLSKILGANWQQSVICSPSNHTENILKAKMLNQVSNAEIQERIVYNVLTDGYFRKHQNQLIKKLFNAHQQIKQLLPKYGFNYPKNTHHGMFLWIDTGCNSTELALAAKKAGFLVAPGQLFNTHQKPSTHIRINVALTDESFLVWLKTYKNQQY